jgi:hypothetical protein
MEHQKLIDDYPRQIKQLNFVIEVFRKDIKHADDAHLDSKIVSDFEEKYPKLQ